MRFILVFIGIVIGLSMLEGSIRLFDMAPRIFRLSIYEEESVFQTSTNPLLGYTLKPNFRSTSTNCDHYFPYTNQHGQRDVERELEKPPGVKRVVMLGDSVVAGSGVCDLEQGLSRNLERNLKDKNIEILNFGVPGYCTLSEVAYLKSFGLQFNPDSVAVVYVSNDFVDANPFVRAKTQFSRPHFFNDLFSHSHAFRVLALQLNLFRFGDEFGMTPAEQQIHIGENNRERGFKLLHELSLKYHFNVIIISWPYFTDDKILEADSPEILPEKYDQSLESLTDPYKFPIVRLAQRFKEDFEKRKPTMKSRRRITPRWTYTIGDGTHPSPLGALVAADILQEQFKVNHTYPFKS